MSRQGLMDDTGVDFESTPSQEMAYEEGYKACAEGMYREALGNINNIDCLSDQIEAIMDLIMCADTDCADIQSIKTAAEMCITLHVDLMKEVDAVTNRLKVKE